MDSPPSEVGSVQLTVAWPAPATAVPMVGAPGAVSTAVGVTALECADAVPVPMTLTAATVNVYA